LIDAVEVGPIVGPVLSGRGERLRLVVGCTATDRRDVEAVESY
jgi:hypothetical protein